jgi:hypothetical protein
MRREGMASVFGSLRCWVATSEAWGLSRSAGGGEAGRMVTDRLGLDVGS